MNENSYTTNHQLFKFSGHNFGIKSPFSSSLKQNLSCYYFTTSILVCSPPQKPIELKCNFDLWFSLDFDLWFVLD